MRPFKYLAIIITTCILNSCSDTIVIQAPPGPIDESAQALPVSGQFTKRALIEDYTGTWCGNCAKVAYGIDLVFAQPQIKAVAVAIHNGNDPYHYTPFQPLKNLISPDHDLELPQARLNRTITWTDPDTNSQQVFDLTSANTGLGLAMSSTVTPTNINLTVKVEFAQNYSDLRIVVLILENHLTYRQVNYSTYYGGLNIPAFDHNHVLRAPLTNILGDVLTEPTLSGETITKNYSVALPLLTPYKNISNPANVSFVAFIVDQDNKVLNVRGAEANEIQLLEKNP